MKKKILLTFLLTILGTGSVAALFISSENIVRYHNNFIRRFPPHVAEPSGSLNLGFNSYYFAGRADGKIYLGNLTAPLQVLAIDTAMAAKNSFQIELKEKDLPFDTPQLKVLGKHFFMYEGAVPYIFSGKVANWKGSLRIKDGFYFSQLAPIDSSHVAVRYIDKSTGQNLLGVIDLDRKSSIKGYGLLQKQFDGIFDTDGILHVTDSKIVYNYRYRNGYVLAANSLKLVRRGKTIDTVETVVMKLDTVKSRGYITYAAPPHVVNRVSAVSGKYLFVNSTMPGNNEHLTIWKTASIIDVYNLDDNSYAGSFPLHFKDGKAMRGFIVYGNHVFLLNDNQLIRYMLRDFASER